MLFSGLALNAIALALLYQPVQWHVARTQSPTDDHETNAAPSDTPEIKCSYCMLSSRKNRNIFSSQYLYNSDNQSVTGYEIIDPGTPMMSRANDGWYSAKNSNYGSRVSLTSAGKFNTRIESKTNIATLSNRPSFANLNSLVDGKRKVPRNNSATELGNYGAQGLPASDRSSYTNLRALAKEEKRNYYGQGAVPASNRSSYTNL